MNQEPLFSVLIANYNNGKYLQEAIDSVKTQTYTNWEIILVDDGSTDNSHELYKLYADDNRIKVFYNDINHGCGYTKRRSAEFANGEICGFLDPDDTLIINAIELMVNAHRAHPDVSLILSRFYYCDKELNIQSESRYLSISEGNSYLTNRDYCPEHFASFKKVFYNKTNGLSPLYKLGVDQDLIFKLEEVGNIYILNEFTYKYRIHKKSIASDSRKSLYWNLIVRYEACIRRGLNPESYPYKDFVSALAFYSLSNEEQNLIHKAENDIITIINSKAYRLGKFILKPFSFFCSKILRK